LKRTFTQKVKQVPSCAADSFDALLKLYISRHQVGATTPSEMNRRARTSAAMIGLAISMGASGLLLPQQGDEAMAVEPIATEPNLPTSSVEPSTGVSTAPAEEPKVVAISAPPTSVKPQAAEKLKQTSPVVEHKVKQGDTLWELSKSYEVQPEAIAASNDIKPSAVLPVGEKLKIPSVNGIVHQVKPGETVETLSKSYGVKPGQLQVSAPVSELGKLQTGESVTVPGNVNDLLKARQDVALNNLKEQRNRLNDSLAELRSEESTNLSKLTTVPMVVASANEAATPVTLPSVVLTPDESRGNSPQAEASVSTSPVIMPVPTPEVALSPAVEPQAVKRSESSVVIPVPTPEVALSPIVEPQAVKRSESSVVIPVPTPEVALSPAVEPQAVKQSESSVVIPVPTPEVALSPIVEPQAVKQSESSAVVPVPTPEVALSPTVEPQAAETPNLAIDPVTSSATPAKPQVPQPVVIEPLVTTQPGNVYQVKPGDTLDEIARRNGLSRSELIQANRLNNPNLIRINQELRIPQDKPGSSANQTVALLPGINSQTSTSAPGQEQRGVTEPTLAIPTPSNRLSSVVLSEGLSQPKPAPSSVLAQSTVVGSTQPNPTVVVDTEPTQSIGSKNNPYVDQLRADILKLREEYRNQRNSGQASVPRNITVPTVTVPVAPSLSNVSTPTRINPEFDPKEYNETVQAELQRRRQQRPNQQASIQIEVPPPESTSELQQDRLATAPAPSDTYNPMMRTPVGERVSPELPSPSAPGIYLPNSETQFNGFIWPTKGVLTSGYGRRWGRMHRGIDIAAPIGTPVVAAAPGVVVSAGWNSGGYGNLVEIQHPDGSLTLYAHNNRILVRRGQEVTQGQQISEMGSTGRSTGPHCHFEVHPPGKGAVNPIALLPRP
jgi:murein DD-endopeptidase MepM/ murein hydrolase activator NlpD